MDLSKDSMLPSLRSALEKIRAINPIQFYAWKISILHYRSMQTLMVGKGAQGFEKYQSREVLDHSYEIEVYTRHSDPVVMGSSSFAIDPLSNLEEQVLKTFNNSLLVGNKPWDLPSKTNGTYEKTLTTDPLIAEDLAAAHEKMYNEIHTKVKTLSQVNVNSGELFTNLKTNYFETSLDLSGQKDSSDVYFEIAIEKLPTPNTQEVLKYKKAISIEDANLSKFIDEAVEETLSIADAQMPKTSDSCVLLVDGETISSLLTNVMVHLDAAREYEKNPFMSKGDLLTKSKKHGDSDKITITLDPSLPVMALSTPYTNEGMKPVKATVIKDDVVTNQIVHGRIGQYLGKEPNYIAGNMIVKPGSMSKEELLKVADECIEIVAFSSLLINPNTLTWSSEIKLGKLYKNGKFDCILKGGVVSGDIRENLADFKFSKEEIKLNEVSQGWQSAKGYVGPDFMLIKSGVKVVGE